MNTNIFGIFGKTSALNSQIWSLIRKIRVTRFVEFYCKRPTWLTGYFCMTRICYSQRFEDDKTLINVSEAYFWPWNSASNIITLKVRVLSPNSWYKHELIFLRIINNSEPSYQCCYLNRLEDLLALSICVQNFSVSEILVEGFKTEQSRTK